jgi:hypothetical protein
MDHMVEIEFMQPWFGNQISLLLFLFTLKSLYSTQFHTLFPPFHFFKAHRAFFIVDKKKKVWAFNMNLRGTFFISNISAYANIDLVHLNESTKSIERV